MSIRKGEEKDLAAAFELVRELAVYENGEDQITTNLEQMKIDGFGEKPVFEFFVAEQDSKIVGIAIYYFRYSTWKGKRLYLEDLIVTESARGTGSGKALLDQIVEEARATQCTGIMWQVLDWNETAIKFYKRYGASLDGEWINCHLDL
ncbi:MAG: GNAT family N-acetyltransferase [Bacteroidota bacterium]